MTENITKMTCSAGEKDCYQKKGGMDAGQGKHRSSATLFLMLPNRVVVGRLKAK